MRAIVAGRTDPSIACEQESVDVLGIAGILPLDHTFWLGDSPGKSIALQELRSADASQATLPAVTFPFESYRRSGGGRIANVLAWLGSSGQRVAVCGAVGDDEAGRIVLADLRKDRVDVGHVKTCTQRYTRLVFLVATSRAPAAQVHVKRRPLASFSPGLLASLPASEILLVGRANRAVLTHLTSFKKDSSPKVAMHLANWPWRQGEQAMHRELFTRADIIVADEAVLRPVKRSFRLSDDASLEQLAEKTSAQVLVIYGGVNRVTRSLDALAQFQGQMIARASER